MLLSKTPWGASFLDRVRTAEQGPCLDAACGDCLSPEILNADGSVREWVGKYLDVEDRKRAEAELREADRRKNEFLAMLAHELRNPLAPMLNAVQVLRLASNDREVVESASVM